MHVSLRSTLFLFVTASVAAGACGGNVVVDQPTGAGGAGAATMGAAAAATTSGGVTTSIVSVSSTSSTTTGTSSGAGACTDPMDTQILAMTVILPIAVNCSALHPTDMAGDRMCIQAGTGLTPACSACLAQDTTCSIQFCLAACVNNPNDPGCTDCRTRFCRDSLAACSGRVREVGAQSCSSLLGGGPEGHSWVQGLVASDFATTTAFAVYQEYGACACGTCAQCAMDYCTGKLLAGAKCASCIMQQCGSLEAACQKN
jgi:hypothetical protein